MFTIFHPSWKELFENTSFNQHIENIYTFYNEHTVYPAKEHIFRVFEMDVHDIQIVLLGQDPYHKKGQAHGLSFSVPEGIKVPPSLRNIFKELKLEFPERNYTFASGNIERWFKEEHIFLLNASLTVMEGKPGSHMKYWETFTDEVIQFISQKNSSCVFLLLGNYAKSKSKFISHQENIVSAPHPSPLARGFIGSNVFRQVEERLGKTISWNL